MTSTGVVLDPNGIDLAGGGSAPAITFASGRFFIAFRDSATGASSIMTVDPSGSVLDGPVPVDNEGANLAIAGDGTNALLCYTNSIRSPGKPEHVVLLDPDLMTLAQTDTSVQLAEFCTVAGGPTGFLVGWSPSSSAGAFVRRYGTSGSPIDPAAIAATIWPRGATRAGTGYLLAGEGGLQRIEDGSNTLTAPIPLPGESNYPVLTTDGSLHTVAWRAKLTYEVASARVDEGGVSLEATPRLVAHGSPAQLEPTMTTVAGAPFAAFVEATESDSTIRYGLVDPSGATAFAGSALASAHQPVAASNATGSLLAWVDNTDNLWAAPIANDGSLGAAVPLIAGAFNPRLTGTSTGFALTYREANDDDIDGNEGVILLDLDNDGEPVAPLDGLATASEVTPVAVGNDLVLVFKEKPKNPGDVWAGCTANVSVVMLGDVAAGENATAASDGTQALAVWTDSASKRVRAAFVDPLCSPVLPFMLTPGGVRTAGASVLFDGTDFIVTWRELDGAGVDLRGARVSTSGMVLDPGGFDISAEDENEGWAALLGVGTARLAAYPRFDPVADGMRLRLRSLTPAP
ncbi:MAG: hypothetical protein JNK04_10575 [Myxococcales bacterium]|nr:hypothetical protein [Myxococcales bacterium]